MASVQVHKRAGQAANAAELCFVLVEADRSLEHYLDLAPVCCPMPRVARI